MYMKMMELKFPIKVICLPLTQESDTTISEPSLNPRLSRPKSRPLVFDRFSRDLSTKYLYILMHVLFLYNKSNNKMKFSFCLCTTT